MLLCCCNTPVQYPTQQAHIQHKWCEQTSSCSPVDIISRGAACVLALDACPKVLAGAEIKGLLQFPHPGCHAHMRFRVCHIFIHGRAESPGQQAWDSPVCQGCLQDSPVADDSVGCFTPYIWLRAFQAAALIAACQELVLHFLLLQREQWLLLQGKSL